MHHPGVNYKSTGLDWELGFSHGRSLSEAERESAIHQVLGPASRVKLGEMKRVATREADSRGENEARPQYREPQRDIGTLRVAEETLSSQTS